MWDAVKFVKGVEDAMVVEIAVVSEVEALMMLQNALFVQDERL